MTKKYFIKEIENNRIYGDPLSYTVFLCDPESNRELPILVDFYISFYKEKNKSYLEKAIISKIQSLHIENEKDVEAVLKDVNLTNQIYNQIYDQVHADFLNGHFNSLL